MLILTADGSDTELMPAEISQTKETLLLLETVFLMFRKLEKCKACKL
jgi:hypothetical protein